MMKPILIDALHINMGGALMILNHLVDRLSALQVDYVLLKDDRCPSLRREKEAREVVVMSCAERARKAYYRRHRDDFSSVLCMGNIPPAIRMSAPVHTYIHNVSLLLIPSDYKWINKAKALLKRAYIRSLSKYTDTWMVQTDNTAQLVNRYLNGRALPVHFFPFFHIPEEMNRTAWSSRTDYVFVGEYTGAKGHEYLVEAWGKLAEQGLYPVLHLTSKSTDLKVLIGKAVDKGARIVNHGYVSFDKVVELYNLSKATVYPSLNESLGLGIIEAIEAGCDVIGCDLPYIYSACKPSEVFQPRNADSIVEAVKRYEEGKSLRTEILIKDRADDLIRLLTGK